MSKANLAVVLSVLALLLSAISGGFATASWRSSVANSLALDQGKAVAEQRDSRLAKVEKWIDSAKEGKSQWELAEAQFAKYDFTTPEKALRSEVQARLNKHWAAILCYQAKVSEAIARERLETLKVCKTIEYGGKIILLVSVQERGIAKYEAVAMEKDAASGLWYEEKVGWIQEENIRKVVDQWTSKGKLEEEK